MKHIVERLKEKRDIEIAKSILESNGYRVSKSTRRVKESTGTYEWSKEWEKEYGETCRVKYCTVGDNLGAVYEPDGIEFDDYGVSIIDNTGELIAGTGYDDDADGFATEEEAKKWVENWFAKNMNGSNSSYKWSGMREDFVSPFPVNHYYSESDRYFGIVDKPDSGYLQDGYSYRAWIKDSVTGMYVIRKAPQFKTEEEAKKWVENWFAENMNESKRFRKPMNESSKINESEDGWKFWEMPKGYRGPWAPNQYEKDYGQGLIGTIIPPFKAPWVEEYSDEYIAYLWDNNTASQVGGDYNEKRFDDIESAKSYLDDLAASSTSSITDSKRFRKSMRRVKESSNGDLRNEILQKGLTLEQAREMYLEHIDGNVEEYGPFEESEEMDMYKSAARKLKVSLDRVVLAAEGSEISNYWDMYRKVGEGEISDVVSVSTMYSYTGLATFK